MRTLYALGAVVGFGTTAFALSPTAHAGDWSVGFTIGGPGYVVVAPPPVYAPAPPPRYYEPPAYEYTPGYYYAPPRYYEPPRWHHEHDEDRHRWHEWRREHYHDDDD